MNNVEQKKEELKKLFYSSFTEAEIKELLSLNYKEYKELLCEVKSELGLPANYRRQPKRYWKYTNDSYYILKKDYNNNSLEIISYYPTEEIAKEKLNGILLDKNCEYTIHKATDENLIDLIYEQYYVKKNNWECIINKCKLPYHKFYELLNIVKIQCGINNKSLRDDRFIYEYTPTNKFVIKKYINGKYVNYGYYKDKEVAIHARNYLESINWDYNLWQDDKSRVVGEVIK